MRVTILLIVISAASASAAPKLGTQFRNLYRKPLPGAPRHSDRIINGEVAPPHSIPFQAFLEVSNVDSGWYCGGSLIKPNVILTAGHCGDGAVSAKITLGAHNVLMHEDTQVVISSSNIIVHPNFDMVSISNDIAMVILPQKVTLNDYIKTVPLPESDNSDYLGEMARVSGWGLTDGTGNILSSELRYTQNPVISNQECNDVYGVVQPYQLCISGDGGHSSCNGDSGGPLTINGVQVGVVSYGAEYCQYGYPSAFTRTGSFLNWIEDNSS